MNTPSLIALASLPLVIVAVVLAYGFGRDGLAWALMAVNVGLLGWAWVSSRRR
jgi:hypothetical protein